MSGATAADVLLRQHRAQSPIQKGVYAHQSPISKAPNTAPTAEPASFSNHKFDATTRPTLPASSFYSQQQDSKSPVQSTFSAPHPQKSNRRQLSPSPSPRSPSPSMCSPSPRHTSAAVASSGSDSSSPGDTMTLSGARQPNMDRIQQILEDFFSSDSGSSESEENLETVLSSVLRDPLENCMEGIEDLATGILRTGKLSVQGEAGDMSKLQPVLLGLQASDRELPQLLPQLMQVPFFEQVDTDEGLSGWSSYGQGLAPEDFLACGHIRLGLPIDTAIYHLLNRHCAKGAKQAEEVIQTAQTVEYVKKSPGKHLMPPLICSASVHSSPSPPLHDKFPPHRFEFRRVSTDGDEEICVPLYNGHTLTNRRQLSGDSGVLTDNDMNHLRPPGSRADRRSFQKSKGGSDSSLVSSDSRGDYYQHSQKSTSSMSFPFSPMSSTASLPLVHLPVESTGEPIGTIVEEDLNGQSRTIVTPPPSTTQHRRRKTSLYQQPSTTSLSGSEVSDDGNSSMSGRLSFDRNQWNTTVMDNNMIVAMFGDTTFPLLVWNPKLKLDFEMSSSVVTLTGVVVGINPNKPFLTIRLHNPTPHRMAFSIRAYRQTTIHNCHVVYPLHGLHILEQAQCWEENAYIHQESSEKNEYIIVELFFATLEANKPSWNVMRKYAAMKAKKNHPSNRRPSRKVSNFQMPGIVERKHDNLKQVIAHGLQCVVKNKHSTAETIFTQALFLPDFQRIELKAFVYICLAVVAYRRQKAGDIESLTHAMKLVNSVDKLVEACEAPRTIRMPRTVHLVKQLRKELNFSDIVKNIRKSGARHKHRKLVSHYRSEGTSTLITEEGGYLSHRKTTLFVPQGSLESQTEVTLASPDHKQLQAMLVSTGWDKMVHIVCAVHIECNPSVGRFQQTVKVSTSLSDYTQSSKSTLHPLLLLHSCYLRKWEDVTSDASSAVRLSESHVDITTDRTGWLAAAQVEIDPIRIASMAMQALSISPMTLKVWVFGQHFPDDIMQITVLMSPNKDSEDPAESAATEYEGSIKHTPISFPYLIQAYPGEQLCCQLRGCFEPDTNSGESDLNFRFKATQTHDCLSGKFVHLTVPLARCRGGGKLVISRHLSGSERWEDIADVSIHVSNASGNAATSSTDSNTAELKT